MMARIIPAASMPMPNGGPENRLVQPKYFASQGCTCSRKSGASTKIAHSPYTTLGIAASSSVRKEIVPRSGFGHISVVNTATPTESGMAITRATSEETRVP